MSRIEAVYQDGVFRPLGQVGLPQNQRVRLTVESLPGTDLSEWLEEVHEVQQQITSARGFLPGSTPGIAEDRRR
ncbi:MAG: antitoxin family protein [Thermoguttaceae bacterium]|jgi:predicted DNA-binding antitoxin AbrB/MazE fold protein